MMNEIKVVNEFFHIADLYDAYINCRRGKKSINAMKFEIDLEKNLFDLREELNFNLYQISRAIVFVVLKPKVREIWASDFRDRVVHHLIVRKIEQYYENNNFHNHFLDSSFANRKGKGTHLALKVVKEYLKCNRYYLKLDIKSFFNSIDRNILFNIVKKDLSLIKFENKDIYLSLLDKIIFHKYTNNYVKTYKKNKYLKRGEDIFKKVPFYKSLFSAEPLDKGLPIGNLTSQFLSNVYLNKLDYFVVDELGFNNYIRYVDDFVIFSDSKVELECLIEKVSVFLNEKLKLELHPEKIILDEVVNGINFLGYYVRPNYCLVRNNVVKNLKEKLYYFLKDYNDNKKKLSIDELKKIQSVVNSYFGHFNFSNSYNLKKKMIKKLDEYFKKNKTLNNKHSIVFKDDLNFKNVYLQYQYFEKKYRNHLILFQMGNFYRFFNEQAEFISKKINLKTQIRKYSGKNHLICGFPINSKKISLIKNLNINFVMVKQLDNELMSGLKERQEFEIISNCEKVSFKGGFQVESEGLNSILKWNLNSMTPIEVFTKLNKILENEKNKIS